MPSSSYGYTLEELDTVSTSLDALPYSLDSDYWKGGKLYLTYFDANHQPIKFLESVNADPVGLNFRSSTFITQEYEFFPGYLTFLKKISVMIEDSDYSPLVTVAVGYRNYLSDPIKYTGFQTPIVKTDGVTLSSEYCFRVTGRYLTFKVLIKGTDDNVGGGYKFAQGIEILDMSKGGRR